MEKYRKLLSIAEKAAAKSYSPYSKYKVGAALLAKSGKVYTGTNVENSSYGLSLCAERSAVVSAVSSGERNFTAIAVAAKGSRGCTPCGACRQFIYEFGEKIEVVCKEKGKIQIKKISELLPQGFKFNK